MIKEVIEELEYETSEAGKLGVTIDDIIKFLHLWGISNEEITQTLLRLGDEQDNVLKVLEAFELSALDVANALGVETEEVKKLEDAYKDLGETLENTTLSAAEMKAALRTMIEAGDKPSEEQILAMHRQRIIEAGERGISVREVAGQEPFAHGGLITQPTLLTRVGSSIPFGIMAEKGPEMISPMGQSVNIFVELDGRTIAKVIGAPLVSLVRVKTGMKI